jgi:hypothetical protein
MTIPIHLFLTYTSAISSLIKKRQKCYLSPQRSQREHKLLSSSKQSTTAPQKNIQMDRLWCLFYSQKGLIPVLPIEKKILFNHDHYHGEEVAVCIGGLADLNTNIILRNGTSASIRSLLKSFPSSKGMSHPLLFHCIESNASGQVVMATYQK